MKRNTRRIFIMLAAALAVVFAVLIAGADFLLDYALKPGEKAERDAEREVLVRSLYPGTVEWMDSLRAGGVMRDTFIVNDDGLRLHAYYASKDSAQGTAVLSHGYQDNALTMMMLGRIYRDSLNFNIMVPDHESHGRSEGDAIRMGWKDRINLERWITVADSMWAGRPVLLHGISMGAATVMMCSGDELPPAVCGIIEDCGYTSVWDEFAGEIGNRFGLPVHPLMDIASIMCDVRYGWNFREASALEQVRRSSLPMLFIHGSADTFVPTDMVYPLYEAKMVGYKRLWIAPGSAHAMSYHDHPAEYVGLMKDFVARVIDERTKNI